MQITFGGESVCCARQARDELAAFGMAPPPAFHRANAIFNPLGQASARGWLLLTRASLDNLDLNALHDLVITDVLAVGGQPQTPSLTFSSLCFTREPQDLFPSIADDDPNALFLCEVSDARWRVSNPYYHCSLIASYNVRAPNYSSTYYDATMNGGGAGVPWTWTTMLADMWSLLATQLGSFPGLPVTPDGTPDAFVYQGVDCWAAICDVLWKLGQAVRWSPEENTYQIVALGAADSNATTALSAADQARLRTDDASYLPIVRGRLPEKLKFCFKRRQVYPGSTLVTPGEQGQWFNTGLYTVTLNMGVTGVEPGTIHPIHDDLPALVDTTGTVTNLAALNARANMLKTIYLNQVQGTGGGRLHRTYAGLVDVQPNGQLRGVAVRQVSNPGQDNDGGLVTEVLRWPYRMPRVDEQGQWEEGRGDDSTALHAPDVRPGWPQWGQAGVGDNNYWRHSDPSIPTYFTPGCIDLSTIAGMPNTIEAMPFVTTRELKVDQLAVWIELAGDSGALVRGAIYQATSGVNLWPSALVVDSGDLAADGAKGYVTKAVNVTLYPGVLYWFAFNCQTGNTAYPLAPSVGGSYTEPLVVFGTVATHWDDYEGILLPFAYGAYPATFPAYNAAFLVDLSDVVGYAGTFAIRIAKQV